MHTACVRAKARRLLTRPSNAAFRANSAVHACGADSTCAKLALALRSSVIQLILLHCRVLCCVCFI